MSVLLHHQGLNVYTPRHQYTLYNVSTTLSPTIKYTDAEVFIRLILGDGAVQTLDKVY
jgi:hypothetical protein